MSEIKYTAKKINEGVVTAQNITASLGVNEYSGNVLSFKENTPDNEFDLNFFLEEVNSSKGGDKILSNSKINEEVISQLRSVGFKDYDISRVLNGDITLEELWNEIYSGHPISQNSTTKRDILEASLINEYNMSLDDIDLNYNSIEDIEKQIDRLTQDIEQARENDFNVGVTEASATNRLMEYMSRTGENLEEAIENCKVAYKCKNSSGDIVYFYGELGGVLGIGYQVLEEISYKDMFGEGELYKKLCEVVPKRVEEYNNGMLWWKETKTREVQDVTWTEAQMEFQRYLNDLISQEDYHEFHEDTDLTKKMLDERELLEYIVNNINTEIDYYLNYVDPYINAQDFEEKNNVNLQNIEKLKSICEGTSYNFGDVENVTIENVDDMMAILSCLFNDTGNIDSNRVSIYGSDGSVNGLYNFTCYDENFNHYINDWNQVLREEEKEIFNYILNTEGAQAAYDYLSDIARIIDQRWLESERLKDQDWAERHQVLASAGSVVVTPFEGIAAACYSLNSLAKGTDLWRTDVYSSGIQWRGSVSNAISTKHPIGAFFYDTGMSMVDTSALIVSSALTGGAGAPLLSAATMGSRSYVSSLNDALDRGISLDTSIYYALGSAIIESICENYSVGHLMNLENKIGEGTISFIKKVAPRNSIQEKALYIAAGAITQGIAEGEEELCTEVLNSFYDQILCKESSNFNLAVQSYLNLGMSEDEAIRNAFIDESKNCALAFAGGFASGVAFGGFKAGKITRQAAVNQVNVIDLDNNIKMMGEVFESMNNTSSINPLESILNTGTEAINRAKAAISSKFMSASADEINVKYQKANFNYDIDDYFYKNKYVEFWEKNGLSDDLICLMCQHSEEEIINFIDYYNKVGEKPELNDVNLSRFSDENILSYIKQGYSLELCDFFGDVNLLENIGVISENLSLEFIRENKKALNDVASDKLVLDFISNDLISQSEKEFVIKNCKDELPQALSHFGLAFTLKYSEYIPELLEYSRMPYFELIVDVFPHIDSKSEFLKNIKRLEEIFNNSASIPVINTYLKNPDCFYELEKIELMTSFKDKFVTMIKENNINPVYKALLNEYAIGRNIYNLVFESELDLKKIYSLIEQLPDDSSFCKKYEDFINILSKIKNLSDGEKSNLDLWNEFLKSIDSYNDKAFLEDLLDCTAIDEVRNHILDVNDSEQLKKYPQEVINYNGTDITVVTIDDYDFELLITAIGPKLTSVKVDTAKIASEIIEHPEIWMDMNAKGNNQISMSRISASSFCSWSGVILGFSEIRKNQITSYNNCDAVTPMNIVEPSRLDFVSRNVLNITDRYNKIFDTFIVPEKIRSYEEIRSERYIYDENGELEKFPPDYIVEKDNVELRKETLKWASMYGQKIIRFDYDGIFSKAKQECLDLMNQVKSGEVEYTSDVQNKINMLGNIMDYFGNEQINQSVREEYYSFLEYLFKNVDYDFSQLADKNRNDTRFQQIYEKYKK